MKILILNRGSSSIKASLFHFAQLPKHFVEPEWEGKIEWKNQEIKEEALQALLKTLSLGQIDAAGHRIVHGGNLYKESVLIDKKVKEEIRKFSELAPLHNLGDLEGISILEKLLPSKPQIAVFDTSFHHNLPAAAAIYPGPYRWYEEGIRRFGFHGTSFQYCTRRSEEMLGSMPHKMVICHLGSGASLCAVQRGKSVDTTMGFTPLEGLMMDTRSGTIDPGLLLYLLKKKSSESLSRELYEESGLLGLSGITSDMRDILKNIEKNPRAAIAFDVYLHRLNSCIGSMIASLQGLDTLVFTAGIGENTPLVRERVCDAFAYLNLELDEKKNDLPGKVDTLLSTPASKVRVLLIHTREDFEIARETFIKLQGS